MRRHYVFYGEVQGVGFRYRAMNAARLYGVTGFVRNLWDGSVELEAEGKEEDIDRMLLTIAESRYVWIERQTVREIPEEGSTSFHIL